MGVFRLDVIIFGATGFTGKNTIPPVERLFNEHGKKLTWGIAGRSESKLKDALSEMSKRIGKELTNIPIIIADVNDHGSLVEMTAQAKVIINTCGPFRLYGEQVVKACLETFTHHVDVSGEPQYMESLQLKYHEEAKLKNVYIVSACGFDSIPCDMGIVFMQEKFDGTLNSVETYLYSGGGGDEPGPSVNIGTWESAINGLAYYSELREIRTKLFPHRLPTFRPKLQARSFIHTNDVNNKWSMPFLGSDRSVALRSQRHFYENEKKRPVQIQTYFCLNALLHVFVFIFFGALFSVLCRFKCGRNLLMKFPAFFSGGFFSHEQPSFEKVEKTTFELILKGEGWSEKFEDCNREPTTKPEKKMLVKVSGKNPGYGATTMMLTASALAILEEADKMPNNGGVYPPGAAFARTSMIQVLNRNGVKFEVME